MAVKTFGSERLTSTDINTYLTNSGLVYIKSQTVGTAVASVTVSSAFSTDFDNYKVLWNNGVTSTTTSVNMTLGATATGYNSVLVYGQYGNTTVTAVNNQNGSSWTYMAYGSTDAVVLAAEIYQPFLTKYTMFQSHHIQLSGAGGNAAGYNAGVLTNTTSYTSFTLAPGSGTLTGGTITVYGYRKA